MSYIPCDEGIYKKMFLPPEDKQFIAGMEYLIDESINDFKECEFDTECIDELLDALDSGKGGENEKLISRLEEGADIISFTRKDLEFALKSYKLFVVEQLEEYLEDARGEVLVSEMDSAASELGGYDLDELYKKAETTDYDAVKCEPLKNEDFTYNANGKPRPRWDKGFYIKEKKE